MNKYQLAEKYPYILAWGKNMGSYGYYIEKQLLLAEKEGAPETALFKRDNGEWATFDKLNDAGKKDLEAYRNGDKGGTVLGW